MYMYIYITKASDSENTWMSKMVSWWSKYLNDFIISIFSTRGNISINYVVLWNHPFTKSRLLSILNNFGNGQTFFDSILCFRYHSSTNVIKKPWPNCSSRKILHPPKQVSQQFIHFKRKFSPLIYVLIHTYVVLGYYIPNIFNYFNWCY